MLLKSYPGFEKNSFGSLKESATYLLFPIVKTLEILNPKRTSPFSHLPLVPEIKVRSFMPCELVKCNWKTWPPVSISKPTERELVVPANL